MIPVYQPFLAGREKEYVNQCLDSNWISSKGEFIVRFERGFAAFIGVEHATSVCNGTVALHLAMAALGLKAGDEVIVPTLTYIASVNTIAQTGATPVFVDSDAGSWNLDPADVRRKITARTRAIMAVHLYGLPCDMAALTAICREHQLFLIEDCAEAFGARYQGKAVGSFGDVATFSFYGNKTITTGEGGMVVARDKQVFDRVYHLKTQGVAAHREYWHDEIAYNYRMTNICAAIGLAQLEQAASILERKRRIADWYREGLSGLPLEFHQSADATGHTYWMCSILVGTPELKLALRAHLDTLQIETRPLFYPAHTMPHHARAASFPVAEDLSARGINLPSYPALTAVELASICGAIRDFFELENNR